MKVLVTGAAGFVGSVLVSRLCADAGALRSPITRLVLADMQPAAKGAVASDSRVAQRVGDIADPVFLDGLVADAPDLVFHLASMPGGAAERDPVRGTAINLHAAVRLFEQLANREKPPVVVFTSTVAVYGAAPAAGVDASTPLRPQGSYGTHKLMAELLLSDLTRRGVLDGRCVRLPGIVARAPNAGGHVSAFMSDVIHRLAAGENYTSPVSADAICWWMSVGCCVDNLLRVARLTAAQLNAQPGVTPATARVWTLPVLRFSMADLIDALAGMYGTDRRALVRFAPVEQVEAVFGRQPPLDSSAARALGLQDDGDIETLIGRALDTA